MKVSTRNKLSLLAVYIVLVFSTGFWLHHEVQKSIRQMMEETSELIGRDIKSSLHESLTDFLLKKRSVNRKEFHEIIVTATEKSNTLIAIDIIDKSGLVILSSTNANENKKTTVPRHLFKVNKEPQLTSEFEDMDDKGAQIMWSPVIKNGETLGYMRLTIQGQGIAKLFNGIYKILMIAALIGLIALIVLDMLLHVELQRITTELMKGMEAAFRGEVYEPKNTKDEFSEIRDTAKKLGHEIKNAKSKVNLARRELSTVISHLKVGLIIADQENNIDLINDRAKLLVSPGDEVDRHLEGLDQIMSKLNSAFEQLQNSSRLMISEQLFINDDDKTKQINAEFYRLDNHEWQGCVVLLHDQDFIDALNDDLQRATQLRSLSTLLLGAIHDIKAPINAMSLNLELLAEGVEDEALSQHSANAGNSNEHLVYINVLKTELERLNHLISGLYDQTMSSDKGKSEFDLALIIAEICLLINPQARSQQINLQFDHPDQQIHLHGYPGQIKQAVLNIILNGLDSLASGGSLTIKLVRQNDEALLSICDSGPGIPSSLQNQIFDMHFTTKATGTGIGLYVSKQIVKRHGGEIQVKSEYGDGACFEISLPITSIDNEVVS